MALAQFDLARVLRHRRSVLILPLDAILKKVSGRYHKHEVEGELDLALDDGHHDPRQADEQAVVLAEIFNQLGFHLPI